MARRYTSRKGRPHGPSNMPVWGARSFMPGGKGLAALKAALRPPQNSRDEYRMHTEVQYVFSTLTSVYMRALINIKAAGYGNLRITSMTYGDGKPEYGSGRWTVVILVTTV